MKVHISPGKPWPVEQIPSRFISVALDVSQIIGGYWWDSSASSRNGLGEALVPPLNLENDRLAELTEMLTPGYLRIGGTEADRLFFALKKKKPAELPEGYHYFLDQKRWKEVESFSRRINARLMITVNAGPGPRMDKNRWRKKNIRHLLKYTKAKGHDIRVLELGNEVNAYAFFMGFSHRLKPGEYAVDMARLKKTVSAGTSALVAGPALSVWPVLGETLPFLKRFLKQAGNSLDLITWHYYPQQSSRSPFAVRRARKKTLLKPSNLDEAKKQVQKIVKLRNRYQPGVPMWLGETGHAQCGGEPGLSDSFYSGFWWLDQLGLMALNGQKQVIRQTLTGGDYGLLDKKEHSPLPDFWTTLLWNKYAGEKVFSIQPFKERKLRVYLHSLKNRDNGFCLIYINLNTTRPGFITVDTTLPDIRKKAVLTSPDIYSRDIFLNSSLLTEACLPGGPEAGKTGPVRKIELPPLSYGFLLLY